MTNITLNPRRLMNLRGVFQPIDAAEMPSSDATLHQRFAAWATQHALTLALAHADDGVIWGWFDTCWHWSGDAHFKISPKLQFETLQQIRLFGSQAEICLWRATRGFTGRLASDVTSEEPMCIEEPHLLWGSQLDKAHAEQDSFVVWREGVMGMQHAAPKHLMVADDQRPQLTVRHYLDQDKDGCMYVVGSRLVN